MRSQDRVPDRLGQAGSVDDLAAARADLGEVLDVALVEAVEQPVQLVPGAGFGERVAEGLGGNGEAVRHPNALRRELAVHLAKRSVLAAY